MRRGRSWPEPALSLARGLGAVACRANEQRGDIGLAGPCAASAPTSSTSDRTCRDRARRSCRDCSRGADGRACAAVGAGSAANARAAWRFRRSCQWRASRAGWARRRRRRPHRAARQPRARLELARAFDRERDGPVASRPHDRRAEDARVGVACEQTREPAQRVLRPHRPKPPVVEPDVPRVEDARTLEDDRLRARALAAKSWEADLAASAFAGGEVLERLPERLEPGLVAPQTTSPCHGASSARRSFSISEHRDLYDHGTDTSRPAARSSKRAFTSARPWLNQNLDAPAHDVRNSSCAAVGASS